MGAVPDMFKENKDKNKDGHDISKFSTLLP